MKCKICASDIEPITSLLILKKYKTVLNKCSQCGFIQTEEPVWLKEAYKESILKLDIGLLHRNINNSEIISSLIDLLYNNKEINGIDYGGGYGVFTRIMRDKGYDFLQYDPYTSNIFSDGFEISKISQKYDIITAFEVLEHIWDIESFLNDILPNTNLFVFTTELHNSATDFTNWWYVAPDFGQHISFYNMNSLNKLAEKYGFIFYSNSVNYHAFSKVEDLKIKNFIEKVKIIFPKHGLLQKDYQHQLNIYEKTNH